MSAIDQEKRCCASGDALLLFMMFKQTRHTDRYVDAPENIDLQ